MGDEEIEGQNGGGFNQGDSEAPVYLSAKFISHPPHGEKNPYSAPVLGGRYSLSLGAIFASLGTHLGTLQVDGGLAGSGRLLASWL